MIINFLGNKFMNNIQELYNTIYKRKSIRQYNMTPLDDSVLTEISDYIAQLETLYAGLEMETKIVTTEQVKTGFQKPAPHYVAIFSEKNDKNLLNIGFMIQLLSLYLTNRGIGSCWQGIPSPMSELKKSSKYEFVIFLAFGNTEEPICRKDISEFKRNSINEITDIKDLDDLLEPARLAPSAVNNQPWFFTGDKNTIHVYCKELNIFKGFLLKKYNMMDVGIALSHLWLAIKKENKDVSVFADTGAEQNVPDGYYYVNSMKIV